MAVLRFHDHRLIASGEIGYDQAGDFARLCDRFLADHRTAAGIIDLSGATMLVSPCVTAIYEDSRTYHPPVTLEPIPIMLHPVFQQPQY